MDEPLFSGRFYLIYKLEIYKDRLLYSSPASRKAIPLKQIANVHLSRFFGRLTVETAGGEKLVIQDNNILWFNQGKLKRAYQTIQDLMSSKA